MKPKNKYKGGRVGPYAQLVKTTEVTTKVDKDGFLYGVNPDGSIAWKECAERRPIANGVRQGHTARQGFEVYDKDGHAYQIPYNPAMLKHHQRFWPYMEEIALEICRRIAEGESLKDISASEGMPPLYILHKWRVEQPGFQSIMTEARKMRAEMFHDEIMAAAKFVEEDNAKSAKVKIDAWRHLASVGDPEVYGSRTKVVGDKDQPLSFTFQTGIDRTQAPISAEGRTLEDEPQEDALDDLDGV